MREVKLTRPMIKTPRPKSRRARTPKIVSPEPIMKEKATEHSPKAARDRHDSVKEKHGDSHHHKAGHDGHHHKAGHDGHHHKTGHDPHHKGGHHGDHHATTKGANMSPANSSHPIRPRAGTLTHRDTAHSISSSKGHGKHAKEHDKQSVATSGDMPQVEVRYENTYKMAPDAKHRESSIREIITGVLKENIDSKIYDAASLAGKCRLSSDIIKERVKNLNIHRYKIVTSVIAAQKGDQSMIVSSRCLWDQKNDNSVTVKMEHGNVFVMGMVFVLYSE